MRTKIIALILSGVLLAGCDTLGETAGLGALLGAGVAGAAGGDLLTGALIGGGAGVACYQTNTC